MPSITTRTIGTGKDHATMKAFGQWLQTRNLVANDEIVIAEVYNDQSGAAVNTIDIWPATHDPTHYALIRPAAGLGVNEIDNTGALDYGTSGIELTLALAGNFNICEGVILEGFRIRVVDNGLNTGQYALGIHKHTSITVYRNPEVRRNRFLLSFTGATQFAFQTGVYTSGADITDNIFIHSSGDGFTGKLNYTSNFRRNTIVKRGSAVGVQALVVGNAATTLLMRSNAFLQCGAVPVNRGTMAAANCSNNYADTTMTGTTTGFTVNATLVQSIANDLRPATAGVMVSAGHSSDINTFDVRGKYRGNVPDVGAAMLAAAALPDVPTATITSVVVTAQTVDISGTTANTPLAGTARLKIGGSVTQGPKSVNLGTNTFSVQFANIPGGNYDAPDITFSNDGGTGPAATGGAPFTVNAAVIPTGVITKQYIIGKKVVVKGTVANAPVSGSISLAAGATPNGAVSQGPYAITISGGTFTATIPSAPEGNYLAPSVTLTNNAGTGPAATGGTAVTIADQTPAAIPGVNIQTIGSGKMHANVSAFAAWIKTRDLVANGEVVYAYVYDDQGTADFPAGGNASIYPLTYSATNYVVLRPAPGCSVNDLLTDADGFDFGDVGILMTINNNAQLILSHGLIVEGFRWKIIDNQPATSVVALYVARAQNLGTYPNGVFDCWFRRNRILTLQTGVNNIALHTGLNASTNRLTDNLVISESNGTGGYLLSLNSTGSAERNTFVRRGSSTGSGSVCGATTATIRDTAFINCGAIPMVRTANPTVCSNNYSNLAISGTATGFTFNADLVTDVNTNYKPSSTSALLGTASSNANSTIDSAGRNRGPTPDVGAYQRVPYIDVPVITITSTLVNGQNVTLSGTTTNVPTSGTATLPASGTPNGAVTKGPTALTLGSGTFSVSWTGVETGNYSAPVITCSNAGGTSLNAGNAQPVTILGIEGTPEAPEDTFVATVPGAPSSVSAVAGNAVATVSFTAPLDGGSPITSYRVTASTGQFANGTASPIDVSVPNDVAVTFTVTATNGVGTGAPSAASNSVTPTAPFVASPPGAPTIGTATAGNATASVAFTAPASDGGAAITGYLVTASTGQTGSGSASPISVSVPNGVAVSFTVRAINVAGTGPASASSNVVVPVAPIVVPTAPTIGTAVAGDGQVTVPFTPPSSNGGATITNYRVTASTGQTANGAASPITITMPNGVAATFTVQAQNSAGFGAASAASNSVTPVAVAVARKACILLNGELVVIPDNLLGTGKKPIVWISGRLRQRVASEGTPIVFVNGRYRLLKSSETLTL